MKSMIEKEKFLEKVYPEPNTGCWIYSSAHDKNGYGRTYPKSCHGFRSAHRLSYYLFNGEFDRSLFVLHICDTPWCVNPAHLFLGTNTDNTKDRNTKKRDAKGNNHGMSCLTELDVTKIINLYLTGKYGRPKLARMFNVSAHAIYAIIKGRTWAHLNFDREKVNEVHEIRKNNWKSNHNLHE